MKSSDAIKQVNKKQCYHISHKLNILLIKCSNITFQNDLRNTALRWRLRDLKQKLGIATNL